MYSSDFSALININFTYYHQLTLKNYLNYQFIQFGIHVHLVHSKQIKCTSMSWSSSNNNWALMLCKLVNWLVLIKLLLYFVTLTVWQHFPRSKWLASLLFFSATWQAWEAHFVGQSCLQLSSSGLEAPPLGLLPHSSNLKENIQSIRAYKTF